MQNESEKRAMKKVRSQMVPVSLAIISTIMVMATLYFMKTVLMPFVFALFIYFLMSPLIDYMNQKLHIPRMLAVVVSCVGAILIMISMAVFIFISMKTLITDTDIYFKEISNFLDRTTILLQERGICIDMSIVKKYLDQVPVLDWITSISGEIVSVFGTLLLILIYTFFLLAGKSEEGNVINEDVQLSITRYLSSKCLMSILTGIIVWGTLSFFDIPMAFMFGAITVVLHFIPNIGAIIANVLPIPVILLKYGYGWEFIVSMSVISASQIFVGNILDPKLMGENLGLHPAIVLLSLLFWGFLWGISGMFLAVPITAIIKLAMARSRTLKPVADFMEGKFISGHSTQW